MIIELRVISDDGVVVEDMAINGTSPVYFDAIPYTDSSDVGNGYRSTVDPSKVLKPLSTYNRTRPNDAIVPDLDVGLNYDSGLNAHIFPDVNSVAANGRGWVDVAILAALESLSLYVKIGVGGQRIVEQEELLARVLDEHESHFRGNCSACTSRFEQLRRRDDGAHVWLRHRLRKKADVSCKCKRFGQRRAEIE